MNKRDFLFGWDLQDPYCSSGKYDRKTETLNRVENILITNANEKEKIIHVFFCMDHYICIVVLCAINTMIDIRFIAA